MEPRLCDRANDRHKVYKSTRQILLARSDGPERRVALRSGLLSTRLPDRSVESSGLRRPGEGTGPKGARNSNISRVKDRDGETFVRPLSHSSEMGIAMAEP